MDSRKNLKQIFYHQNHSFANLPDLIKSISICPLPWAETRVTSTPIILHRLSTSKSTTQLAECIPDLSTCLHSHHCLGQHHLPVDLWDNLAAAYLKEHGTPPPLGPVALDLQSTLFYLVVLGNICSLVYMCMYVCIFFFTWCVCCLI